MKRSLYFLAGAVFTTLMFLSCEPSEEPVNEQEINAALTADLPSIYGGDVPYYLELLLDAYKIVPINTYKVEFMGRNEAADGTSTTFKYKVSGTGETPQLDSFFLQVPGCAGNIQSWSPQNSSSLLTGAIKWNRSVSKDGSQEYSITYSGKVPIGIIDATVTRGSTVETKRVLGPCQGIYSLNGSAFIDANENGSKQVGESGISGIKIRLFKDGVANAITEISSATDGSFSFRVVEGSFKLQADPLLNNDSYTGGSLEKSFPNLNENHSGLNFGFKLQTSKIISDFKEGILRVNSEPTRYWVDIIKNAGKRNAVYTEQQMLNLLTGVEGMYLANPFNFGTDKRAAALNFLTRPIRTELDKYLQQLLTAELNVASGKGAQSLGSTIKNNEFNQSLLNYAEAVACREMGTCPAESTTLSAQTITIKLVSKSDTEMLSFFNGSGGIGK